MSKIAQRCPLKLGYERYFYVWQLPDIEFPKIIIDFFGVGRIACPEFRVGKMLILQENLKCF
ncbi:MAG TPA: hypothetical protein V6D25_20730 [Leptolyngbyaceae cyanobacterium]